MSPRTFDGKSLSLISPSDVVSQSPLDDPLA
jgi:hypothetical protein